MPFILSIKDKGKYHPISCHKGTDRG